MWLLVISPSSILCFYHGKLPELDSFWFVIYFKDINFGGYFLKKAFIWKKTELRLESRFVKFERKEIFYWKRWKKMPCCFKMVWMMHKDIFIRVNLVFIQIWRIIWPQNSIAEKIKRDLSICFNIYFNTHSKFIKHYFNRKNCI